MNTSYLLACIEHDAGNPAHPFPGKSFGWSSHVREALRRLGARMFGLWAVRHRIPAGFVLESLRRVPLQEASK